MFNKPIDKMNFDELRNAVQILYDAFAKQSREYSDLLQNLDFDNFTPEVKKAVNSTVSSKDLETIIKQTESAITTQATRMYDLDKAETVYDKNDMEDTSLIYRLVNVVEPNAPESYTYYYYNSIDGEWKELEGSSIFTLFEQTAKGFVFKGSVIVGGTISGVEIVGGKIKTIGTETGADIVIGADEYGNRGDISIGGVGHIYAVPFVGEDNHTAVYITADSELKISCDTFTLDANTVKGLGLPLVFS